MDENFLAQFRATLESASARLLEIPEAEIKVALNAVGGRAYPFSQIV